MISVRTLQHALYRSAKEAPVVEDFCSRSVGLCCAPPPDRPPAAERGPDRPGDQRWRPKAALDPRRESPHQLRPTTATSRGSPQLSASTHKVPTSRPRTHPRLTLAV
jgi:hypothetical protein